MYESQPPFVLSGSFSPGNVLTVSEFVGIRSAGAPDE
jgi:hypothetical protein